MAGDWLKLRHDLDDDPHVLRAQELLGIADIDLLIGKLRRLWKHGDQHTVDGLIAFGNPAMIDRIVRMEGFAAALEKVGWLVFCEQGCLIPRFDEHNSKSAKRRALDAARKRASRSAEYPQEKRTGNGQTNDKGEIFFPAPLCTERFAEVWRQWETFRVEKRNPLKPTTVALQLKKLAALGERGAIACLEYSMAQGYTGLFPERVNGSNTGGRMGPGGRIDAQPGKYDGIGIRCGPETEGDATAATPAKDAKAAGPDTPLVAVDDPAPGQR